MRFTTRNLLDENIEAARLGKFEGFKVLIALLHLLMIKSQLSIGVIAPDKHFSEVKVYRALRSGIPSGKRSILGSFIYRLSLFLCIRVIANG